MKGAWEVHCLWGIYTVWCWMCGTDVHVSQHAVVLVWTVWGMFTCACSL
jgi:hypothetical protein